MHRWGLLSLLLAASTSAHAASLSVPVKASDLHFQRGLDPGASTVFVADSWRATIAIPSTTFAAEPFSIDFQFDPSLRFTISADAIRVDLVGALGRVDYEFGASVTENAQPGQSHFLISNMTTTSASSRTVAFQSDLTGEAIGVGVATFDRLSGKVAVPGHSFVVSDVDFSFTPNAIDLADDGLAGKFATTVSLIIGASIDIPASQLDGLAPVITVPEPGGLIVLTAVAIGAVRRRRVVGIA